MHGISIVIVTWNSRGEIAQCLRSLRLGLRGIHHEIIIVDNDSRDATPYIVSRDFPDVRLIENSTNTGFGEGNNIGIKHAQFDHILLLNPDTIVTATAIRRLWDHLAVYPHVGAVGPEQTNARGRRLFTTSKLSVRGITAFLLEDILWRLFRVHVTLTPLVVPARFLNAGCLLARRRLLGNTHQWFDPKLLFYGEEFTFFPKVRERGWTVHFVRDATIVHHRDRSINQSGRRTKTAIASFSRIIARTIR